MAKSGRNAPCPCGSGKKYKKCCQPSDQAAAAEAAKEQERQRAANLISMPRRSGSFFFVEEDLIDDYSNRVNDLIKDGDLDGAEEACKELEEKFPESIDCPWRRAMLYEARGEIEQAIAYNERCIEIIKTDPKGYGTSGFYEEAIAGLRLKLTARDPAKDVTDDFP